MQTARPDRAPDYAPDLSLGRAGVLLGKSAEQMRGLIARGTLTARQTPEGWLRVDAAQVYAMRDALTRDTLGKRLDTSEGPKYD